jgi:hypothetical protein
VIERVFASWKTSAAGVALLAVTAVFLMGRITLNQFMAAVGMLAGGGFVLSKDADVHGGKQ